MNFTKLKYANEKVTDYNFEKKSTLVENSTPNINAEKLWAQKHTATQNFIPSLEGQFGQYGKVSNREMNSIINNKRIQKEIDYFKNYSK